MEGSCDKIAEMEEIKMIRIIEFFYKTFGSNGNFAVGVMFFAMLVFGIVIAMKGRRVMSVLVSLCGVAVGILAGAMVGLLVFDSFILMIIFAIIGGSLLVLLTRFVKGIVYFVGISTLSFFLAFVMTTETYITNTQVTENTLLLADLVFAMIMGLLSLVKSRVIIAFVTATSGGIMTSIGILGLFGYYFSNRVTWTIAIAVAIFGMFIQLLGFAFFKNMLLGKNKKKIKSKHTS